MSVVVLPPQSRKPPNRQLNVGVIDLSVYQTPTTAMIPYIWCTLKTYYEENGKNRDFWNWYDPWIFADCRSDDEIFDYLTSNPPDVMGFSVYVWNEKRMNYLAKTIKERFPNCLIVYGGPQSNVKYNKNYFRERPWINLSVPGDAYGEVIFTDVLDYFVDYEQFNPENVTYTYYKDKSDNPVLSSKPLNKRSFRWPTNIFKAQEKILFPWLTTTQYSIISLFETTRGCPYQCTYCDWGGGTFTKVTRKPRETIDAESEWLSTHTKSLLMFITDANFGIFKEDLVTADVVITNAKAHGYPKIVSIENAKNNIDRVTEITKRFAEANLLVQYNIAIQSVDPEIKDQIKRVDIPIDEQVKKIMYLKEHVSDLPVNVEIILGLPGATYEKSLKELDILQQYGIKHGLMHFWQLLPEAPAYSPELREQYKLRTVFKSAALPDGFVCKPEFKDNPDNVIASNAIVNNEAEAVVGTYSYTPDDWIKMVLVGGLSNAMHISGIRSTLFTYLRQEHGILESDLIDFYLHRYVLSAGFDDKEIQSTLDNLVNFYREWVYNDSFQETAISPFDSFPYLLSPNVYIVYVTLINSGAVLSEFIKHYGTKINDDKIVDLGRYIKGIMLDINYSRLNTRVFTTEYDWKEYFSSNTLINRTTTYKCNDTTIMVGNTSECINWTEQPTETQKYVQYFYLTSTSLYDPKVCQDIEVIS